MSTENSARSPGQVTARANLLAGLRNGRQSRAESPAQQEQTASSAFSPNTAVRQMKANAPVFTPGVSGGDRQVTTPPATTDDYNTGASDYMGALEAQLAALQMSAMQSTPSIAASYGATQGQPQHRHESHAQQQLRTNEEAVAQFLLQRQQQQQQQQLLQSHIAHAQHLDHLRAQAVIAQAGQQQHVAHQQRALFAQIQQEYEQQMRFKAALDAQQGWEQQLAAQEQRQAAQASLQASTRNRQVQKLYSQLVEEEQAGRLDPRLLGGRELWEVAVNAVTEQHNQAQMVAATQEQIRQLQFQQYALHLQQLQQQQATGQSEAERMLRSGTLSPTLQRQAPSAGGHGQQRERLPSTADQAMNWRSRAVSSPKDDLPTLIFGDGDYSTETALNEGSPCSSRSFNSTSNSADETPQTSEEDIEIRPLPSTKGSSVANFKARMSASPSPSPGSSSTGRSPQNLFSHGLKPSLNSSLSTPRPRSADREDSGTTASVLTPVLPASRQPKGPPTDFAGANFASRMNARTRKQALSKLREMSSASPRGVTGVKDAITPVGCC